MGKVIISWLGRWRAGQAIFVGVKLSLILSIAIMISACERPDPDQGLTVDLEATDIPATRSVTIETINPTTTSIPSPTLLPQPTNTLLPEYTGTPTPNPTLPFIGGETVPYDIHTVVFGETLTQIALLYATTVDDLVEINDLTNSDFLNPGQQLLVPGGTIISGPSTKLIPDSELVYSPAAKDFEIDSFVAELDGYLSLYEEEIEGQIVNGTDIVGLVSQRQSVNPRLLLSVVEYQTGWLTSLGSGENDYPLGYSQPGYEGLYQQLSWAANKLNRGFYGRAEGGLTSFSLGDGTRVNFARDINDGTAGVQFLFAAYPSSTQSSWLQDISPGGFFSTYQRLFGNPFAYTVDPLWPDDLTQPVLALPWTSANSWYFTGGPHGGWANGSAWAALDFAPPHDQFGCYKSDMWVTAMSDGLVVVSDFGAVLVDLDKDGYFSTGWVITYLHLESRDRVPAGTIVQTGDRLGHPSCEGGYTNGTHVHVARTYNGRWVSADGDLPFVMDNWVSTGFGTEYDGYLIKGDIIKEACECREESNAITRE